MIKLGAKELRTTLPENIDLKNFKRQELYIVLDNVLDTYNVGAIFRLADATGVKKVYLCGTTETPPNSRIKKASVNTWQWVDWEYKEKTLDAIEDLKKKVPSIKIIAVEQDEKSIPYDEAEYRLPLALVVGNETYGTDKEVLRKVDEIVELPMHGVNISLNVMVSLGIVLYEVLEKHKSS